MSINMNAPKSGKKKLQANYNNGSAFVAQDLYKSYVKSTDFSNVEWKQMDPGAMRELRYVT